MSCSFSSKRRSDWGLWDGRDDVGYRAIIYTACFEMSRCARACSETRWATLWAYAYTRRVSWMRGYSIIVSQSARNWRAEYRSVIAAARRTISTAVATALRRTAPRLRYAPVVFWPGKCRTTAAPVPDRAARGQRSRWRISRRGRRST